MNAGTIALATDSSGSQGSISSSSNILLAAGTTLDASGRSDTILTLANGQTLQGNGTVNGSLLVSPGATVMPGTNSASTGTLTVANDASLQGTTWMKLDRSAATNDVLTAATIEYNGTLRLTSISAPLQVGNSFKLFNASSSYSGAFAALVPATPGAGLAWDTNGLSSGVLSVVSGPAFTGISLSGTKVVLTGTNGPADQTYTLLCSTNVALPLSQWTPVTTNTFLGGNFSVTNAVNPNARQEFYILQVP